MSIKEGERFAAIDLGSNSFRMELARFEHGQLVFDSYFKETVRLGGGLDEQDMLTPPTINKGLACLRRFAEYIRGFNPAFVAAVATQTLREAKNRETFINEGKIALGYPIKIISGREEARLIYNGVCRYLPQNDEPRFVIDIGGRSTEVITGIGFNALHSESVGVGSVNLSLAHFADGKVSAKQCKQAISFASAVMENALTAVGGINVDKASAHGASGTIGAVADIVRARGMSSGKINLAHLQELLDELIVLGVADKARWPGLKEDRVPVIAGGLCALIAAFKVFNLIEINPAKGALRHGLLEDMLAINDPKYQMKALNVRQASVVRLQTTFRCDVTQARRVRALVMAWADELSLRPQVLGYCADVHELGCIVSHLNYHKHGAYLLDCADVLGFSSPELKKMSALILGQTGGLKKMEAHWHDGEFMLKLLLLRLAVLMCHARKDPPPAPLIITPHLHRGQWHYTITIRGDWSGRLPQTFYALKEEINAWKKTPVQVNLFERDEDRED